MVVCQCRGITERQIRRLVRDGASSTREVARATGAGRNCGGCRATVTRVVNQAIDRELAAAQPGTTLLDIAIPVEA